MTAVEQRFVSTMCLKVEVIPGDPKGNRQRFRQAYDDAERFMFGTGDSERDYVAVLETDMELVGSYD